MKLIEHVKEIQEKFEGGDVLINQNYSKTKIIEINKSLPNDFIEFYSYIGDTEPSAYSIIKTPEDDYAFEWFYKIDEIMSSLSCYEDRMPTWLIPFSPDYMGNQFVISIREKDYGSIYLWEHDWEYDEDQDDCELDEYEDNLIFMASSFTEFIIKMEVNDKYLED